MYSKEKTLTSEQVYDGIVVKLFSDKVELDNGYKATREVIHHPGGVCVAALDEDENIFLVEQFRYPFDTVLTEVPAGKLEYGEQPETCGRRELKEETGLAVSDLHQIGTYSKIDRDPRGRTISVAYLVIIDSPVEVTGQDDATKAEWFPITNLPHLAFDHFDIMQDALRIYNTMQINEYGKK